MKAGVVRSLLLLGITAQGAMLLGQSTGTFTATGSMTTARFGHSATLLADGRVLVAGGYTGLYDPLPVPLSGNAITASAELYDVATGAFTPTGNLTTARAYHTATLLADGRVLIAAGRGAGRSEDNLTSAELYDPSTGSFTATGSMSIPSSHDTNTATLLPDGRVLIAGSPNRAELYDPGTGMFTAEGGLTVDLSFNTATMLPDGRILLATYATSKLYDPRSGTFSCTDGDKLLTYHAALLPNGQVFKAGGNDDPGPSAGAELYDPSAGTFTLTRNMTAPRANHTLMLLPDGKVFITGGSSWNSATFSGLEGMAYFCCLASAEIYDASTGLFTGAGSMATPRAGHTATLLNNGTVLLAGGGAGSNTPALATAEVYNPSTLVPAALLFSVSGDGLGQGAIWHAQTGQFASAGNPAGAGEALSLYTTSLSDGLIPPRIAVGGRLAEILFFGAAPGYPDYSQVNFRVPDGITPGSAVSVRLAYLDRWSKEVTIGLR